MLITKEQQEAWLRAYVKENHTQDECIGFIDGINKALEVVKNNLVKSDVSGSLLADERGKGYKEGWSACLDAHGLDE